MPTMDELAEEIRRDVGTFERRSEDQISDFEDGVYPEEIKNFQILKNKF